MRRWSKWVDIGVAKSKNGPLNDFGIYQIRAVNSAGEPIAIGRLVGTDEVGVLYIGRSGYRGKNSARTIANRIREFVYEQHSGGITYARAKITLDEIDEFSGHRLQVRALFLPDDEIDEAEANALRKYFKTHAELPPCNSALPRTAEEE